MPFRQFRFLSVAMVLVLLVAGCQMAPAPTGVGTATPMVAEEATPTPMEAITPEMAVTAEMTATLEVEMTPELTATIEVTGTPEVGMTPPLTATTKMTTASLSIPFEAVQIILDFAPESWTPPHSHGGPVLVTVLEGEMTVRQEETGEETLFAAGDFWIEELGEVHTAGNAGEANARLAVVFLLPEGASLTTVAEGTDTDSLPPGPTQIYRTNMPVTTDAGAE